MIITKTPLRISFVGGGSDLKAYYLHRPGAVVSTAIDAYIYVTANPRPDRMIRVSYSKTEWAKEADEIDHNIIRESLKLAGIQEGIDISYVGDLRIATVGTGLGASSALAVGVLQALHAFKREKVSPEHLAREACEVEIERLGHPIGKQDQYICAYGGFSHITFHPDERVVVEVLPLSRELKGVLQKNLLLFYTGLVSDSLSVLGEQKEKTSENLEILSEMTGFTSELKENLLRGSLEGFGTLLHKNWILKKKLASKITNGVIDGFYERALGAGAEGGKILGSGGGGFLLLYCKGEKQDEVRKALSPLQEFKFSFELEGSKILYQS